MNGKLMSKNRDKDSESKSIKDNKIFNDNTFTTKSDDEMKTKSIIIPSFNSDFLNTGFDVDLNTPNSEYNINDPVCTSEEILCHFFQILQTKSLYLENPKDGILIAAIASEKELSRLIEILKKCIDITIEINVLILYCKYDVLFEISKSKIEEEKNRLEVKSLECKIYKELNDRKNIKYSIITAPYFLRDLSFASLFFELDNRYDQRRVIIDQMIPLNSNVLGLIGFHWSCFEKSKEDDLKRVIESGSNVVYFDQSLSSECDQTPTATAPSPEIFVSCLLIN